LGRVDALLGADNEFSLHLLKDGFNCRDLAPTWLPERRQFEVPAEQAARSIGERQIEKPRSNHGVVDAHDVPKLA